MDLKSPYPIVLLENGLIWNVVSYCALLWSLGAIARDFIKAGMADKLKGILASFLLLQHWHYLFDDKILKRAAHVANRVGSSMV